ncbi:hypothetical protein VTO42DRAFT_1869 [Malbranchea cinnamomea]
MADLKSASTASVQLPVIDISHISTEVGKSMIDAATKYGFLYVDSKSSDFTKEDVDNAFELAKGFFALPYEEKAKFKYQNDNSGWVGMHRERLDPEHQKRGDFKEAMNFREFKDGKAMQALPPFLVPHEPEIAYFLDLCQKTCHRILSLLALGLGIPQDWFTSRHDTSKGPSGTTFRFLYYPSITSPATSNYDHGVDVRAGAHSDYGSITLLFQRDGQPGLEILTPEGNWASVPVRPQQNNSSGIRQLESSFPPILVNIGDLLSYWTCGLLKSTVHRVIFPLEEQQANNNARDRYSMAYFCHPVDSVELEPVPSQLVEQRREELARSGQAAEGPATGGKAPTARDHLLSRLAATYGETRKRE